MSRRKKGVLGEGPRRGRPRLVLILLTFGYVLSLLDRNVLPILVEPIKRDLGITDTQFATLHGLAFIVLYSFAILPLGWLADRLQRKRIIAVGIALWSVMTSLSGFATNYGHLLLSRMGVGIGEAALQPAAYSMIADLFPRQALGRAIAIFSMGGTIGSGIAYIVGGLLLNRVGDGDVMLPIVGAVHVWQATFLSLGLPGLILALALLGMHEPRRNHQENASATSADLNDFFRRNSSFLVLLCGGMALLVSVTTAFLSWLPASLIRNHGLSTGSVGIIFGLSQGFGSGIGFLAGGWLVDRQLRHGTGDAHMRVGMLVAAALLPPLLVVTLAKALWLVVPGAFLLFLLMSLPIPATLAAVQIIVPITMRSFVTSIFMIIANILAIGVSPLVVALMTDKLFGRPDAVNLSLMVFGFLTIPALGVCYALARRPFAARMKAISRIGRPQSRRKITASD